MPRPRKTPVPAAETPPADATNAAETGAAETPVKRRRRRRTSATLLAETANETTALVEAVLRSRGAKGATQDALQSVISWSREIRAEGEALKELSSRPRRQKTQAPADRVSRFEMNRALLDGVLAGTVLLDLRDDGSFLFLHRDSVTAAATTTPAAEAPVEYPEEG